MDTEKEIQRGLAAQSILDSEIYKEAFESVRLAIISQWEKTPIRDHEGQHELRLMIKLLGDVQANIKQVAETGKLAKLQINQEKGALHRFFDNMVSR